MPTPAFNDYNSRHKIKTEVCEDKAYSGEKTSYIGKEKHKQMFPFDNKTKHLRLDNIAVEIPKRNEPRKAKQKRMKTFGSVHKEQLNRSTITSFYQL